MMQPNKAHHYGGSLSAADIVAALYFYKMNYDPQRPDWPERDRFIMSKGHSVPAQYAALAMLGVIPLDELPTLKLMGSRLQGHPVFRSPPGIEACTGSLGQGLSYAVGVALSARVLGRRFRVFVLLGDGELQEGQVWEAAMTAAHYRLDNLTAIVDRNRLQAMGQTEQLMAVEPIAEKWAAFRWAVREIDGHDMAEICAALDWACAIRGQPAVIIAHTIKGKGVSFLENDVSYHNAPLPPELHERALAELKAALERS